MKRLHKIGRCIFKRMTLLPVLMMLASFSMPAMAEDFYELLVTMKNSEQKAFLLSKKPVVSFTETDCVVDYDSFTSYFNLGEIKDVTITNVPGSVNEIDADKVTLDYTNPDSVVVRGIPANTAVTLYSITGILLDSVFADAEGNACINMSAVTPGTLCIITVNSSKNFKILKK